MGFPRPEMRLKKHTVDLYLLILERENFYGNAKAFGNGDSFTGNH